MSTDKSFVAMEKNVCLVCGKVFDSGAILVHKRLQNIREKDAITGWGLCEEDQAMYDKGYIALVGIDPEKSNASVGSNIRPQDAFRTGSLAHLRRSVCGQVFNVTLPDDIPAIFVEDGVIEKLKTMVTPEESSNADPQLH